MLSWNDVRYFVALAEAGSLAAAGRALGVQHTTIARRVAQLEDQLGVALITRMPSGVQLTPAGERALAHGQAARAELEALALAVRGTDQREAGTVRLTVSESFSGFLNRRLAPLRTAHPELDLHILADDRTYDLARGEADIALRATTTTDGGLRIRKFVEAGWSVYAAPGYLDGRTSPRTVAELGEHALIGYRDELRNIDGARWIRDSELEARVVMQVNSIPAALSAAVGGCGVVVLPCLVAADEPALVRLFDQVIASRTLWLVTHPDVARSARVRVVVDYLMQLAARERSAIEGTRELSASPG